MGCSLLLILALVQNVAHSLEIQGKSAGLQPICGRRVFMGLFYWTFRSYLTCGIYILGLLWLFQNDQLNYKGMQPIKIKWLTVHGTISAIFSWWHACIVTLPAKGVGKFIVIDQLFHLKTSVISLQPIKTNIRGVLRCVFLCVRGKPSTTRDHRHVLFFWLLQSHKVSEMKVFIVRKSSVCLRWRTLFVYHIPSLQDEDLLWIVTVEFVRKRNNPPGFKKYDALNECMFFFLSLFFSVITLFVSSRRSFSILGWHLFWQ